MPFDGTELGPRAKLLIGTLEILRRDGWCQDAWHIYYDLRKAPKHCVIGAAEIVMGLNPGGRGVVRKVVKALDMRYETIVDFNDSRKRTFPEIEAWLEEKISKAINEGK